MRRSVNTLILKPKNTPHTGKVSSAAISECIVIVADVNVVKLSKHSNDHGLAAPSLVQDAHGCSDVLYVRSDVVLQRPSRLKRVEMGLAPPIR